VLHLYGRYCNASKFAGEVDFFEALEAVKRNYPIDENRIVDRGFSMGGASVWHFAVHYPSLWAAASPGAGFAESAQYLKIKITGDAAPPWWEQTLWHYYDRWTTRLTCPICR
jgi:poly(3-hydroxybutyrate) depolymerase